MTEKVARATTTGNLFPALAESIAIPKPPIPRPIERVAEIAVPVPVDRPFTYLVPENLAPAVVAGARVLVPFGPRKVLGVVIVVRQSNDSDRHTLKPISAIIDATPVLPPELLSFLREVATYYLAPLGEVIALALPAVERKAINRLRADGLLARTPTNKVAPSRSYRVIRAAKSEDVELPGGSERGEDPSERRLGPSAHALLTFVVGEGEVAMSKLTERWKGAHSIVAKLSKRGLVDIEERTIEPSAFSTEEPRDAPPSLNDEQQNAVDAIASLLHRVERGANGERESAPRPILLQGVTGSGKTEVYLHAIADALACGRGALVLVPEIALTPQLIGRFRARFGDGVAVVHSALDPAARHAMWRRLHSGELRVAIGARSALFAPVPNLGLIVVDEEHDGSYKQEEGVRYHARDCAILRAHRAHAVCVLGSATPSLEMISLAKQERATRILLTARARAQPLPDVEIVDLRKVGPGPTGSSLVSLRLHRALEATLAAKEQAILFLNRRGFAPAVIRLGCGKLRNCPDCDVSLTYHRNVGRTGRSPSQGGGDARSLPPGLRCHYCDHVENLPDRCPACAGRLVLEGVGTERLEDVLAQAFPSARVARLDRDVASGSDIEAILQRVRARQIDILVGTQMVTKGHDLPFVTLVGVVNADAALSMPDFRAAERTFQLLVQVAGRAGRGDAKGSVIVQTRSPTHPAIVCAARHDVNAFLDRELHDCEELRYPPFSRLILIRLDGPDADKTASFAERLAQVARSSEIVRTERVEVLGPTTAPVPRVRGRFRFRVLLRSEHRKDLRNVARAIKNASAEAPRDVRVVLDVDPLAMM